jgi:nucleotide sugar dehydrogenase
MNHIGVVGFGKIGQAVAANFLNAGFRVTAIDINPALKESLENGKFESSEPGVQNSIVQGLKENRLKADTDPSALSICRAVIVCIPLLTVELPDGSFSIDFEPFDACFCSIAIFVNNKTLVSLETTVPIGTCRERIQKLFDANGKIHGRDYLFIHSPERIQAGTMLTQLRSNPKIVGGLSEEALVAGLDLYSACLPPGIVKPVSSIEVAEMIKLTGMVYRDVNIALVNQISRYCDAANIDLREVLQYTNTDEVTHLLSPGVGVGGHCTPVYPYFLIENFKQAELAFTLAVESRSINREMPDYLASTICKDFSVRSALLLGVGYRPNVKEDTFSPAYSLCRSLQEKGVNVAVHDPLYSQTELNDKGLHPSADIYGNRVDAIFLVTAHREYQELDFDRLAQLGCRVFVDGRNAFKPEPVLAAGIAYKGMGTGCQFPIDQGSAPSHQDAILPLTSPELRNVVRRD